MEKELMKLKNEDLIFRFATENDAKEILEIYRPYIENTTITFEYEVPSVRNLKKESGKFWRNILTLFANMIKKLLAMLMHTEFGAGLHISGMQNCLFILMKIILEMELEKKLYKMLMEILKITKCRKCLRLCNLSQ